MGFSVTIEGLDDLERDAREADGAIADGCHVGVSNACEEGAAEARSTHRYTDRTGDLTRNTTGHVDVWTQDGAGGEIVAKTRYASFVEGGTEPHEIHAKAGRGFVGPLPKGQSRGRGKGGGNLTFQIGGRWVSTPLVHHPGTQPDGFMGRAYLKAERVIERDVEVAVVKAQRILER